MIESRTVLENRRGSLRCKETKKFNDRAIAALTLQIKGVEKEIEKLIRNDEEMLQEVRLTSSVPGVGFISAANLLAEFGSLKQYTSRELSKISGLAPRSFESGISVKKSYSGHRGPKRARQILYLDSISSVRKITSLQNLYDRIVAT